MAILAIPVEHRSINCHYGGRICETGRFYAGSEREVVMKNRVVNQKRKK